MLAFPTMLLDAAQQAGMKIPELANEQNNMNYVDSIKDEYPHFFVYCMLQLCRPITWGNHWRNAEIIAVIPEDRLRKMRGGDFYELGFDP